MSLWKTLWNEPRAPDAAPPQRADWVLVALIVLANLTEGVLQPVVTWRALTVGMSLAIVLTLPWRRLHPLATVVVAFGCVIVVQLVALATSTTWSMLDTAVFIVLLPYALLRWASGREAAAGLVVIAVAFAAALPETQAWSEVIGGGLVLLFPAALGAAVRFRDSARREAVEHVRSRERERLARELHDTVAHHVSAIAVQAQAGKVLAGTRPDAPLDALEVIEKAASRALDDMRRMVRTLRDDREDRYAPGRTLADLDRLIRDNPWSLPVETTYSGRLEALDASLESTVYEVTREALTNAARHARGATRVSVDVRGEEERVHVSVVDDGTFAVTDAEVGFGLRGMTERVELLGGDLHAGPGRLEGWVVEAVLPRRRPRT